MKASFREFERKYGGKVFIIFSVDDEVANPEILKDIKKEIERLQNWGWECVIFSVSIYMSANDSPAWALSATIGKTSIHWAKS